MARNEPRPRRLEARAEERGARRWGMKKANMEINRLEKISKSVKSVKK
jgi:hypothetical protein